MHVDIKSKFHIEALRLLSLWGFWGFYWGLFIGALRETIGDLFGRNIKGKNFFGEIQSVDRNNCYHLGTSTRDIHSIR